MSFSIFSGTPFEVTFQFEGSSESQGLVAGGEEQTVGAVQEGDHGSGTTAPVQTDKATEPVAAAAAPVQENKAAEALPLAGIPVPSHVQKELEAFRQEGEKKAGAALEKKDGEKKSGSQAPAPEEKKPIAPQVDSSKDKAASSSQADCAAPQKSEERAAAGASTSEKVPEKEFKEPVLPQKKSESQAPVSEEKKPVAPQVDSSEDKAASSSQADCAAPQKSEERAAAGASTSEKVPEKERKEPALPQKKAEEEAPAAPLPNLMRQIFEERKQREQAIKEGLKKQDAAPAAPQKKQDAAPKKTDEAALKQVVSQARKEAEDVVSPDYVFRTCTYLWEPIRVNLRGSIREEEFCALEEKIRDIISWAQNLPLREQEVRASGIEEFLNKISAQDWGVQGVRTVVAQMNSHFDGVKKQISQDLQKAFS